MEPSGDTLSYGTPESLGWFRINKILVEAN